MVKRLIFDLDNTLIEWKPEYWNKLKKTFEELNIKYTEELFNNIIKAIDTYENEYEYYSRQNMLNYINKVSNYNFDINFLNVALKNFEKCVPQKDNEIINVLEYLSKKYELVILTNWFTDVQIHRLENYGISKYFKEVFGTENFKTKPNKESFIVAMENRAPNECIMIGDNFDIDIQGAINVGMKAIYVKPNIEKDKKENYVIINKIEDLMEIL